MRNITNALRIFKIIIIGLILNSCCKECDENFGIIQSNLEIEGFYIRTYDCMNLPDTACIRDNSQYIEIFKNTGTCGEIKKLPAVDFTKNSILINHRVLHGKHFFHNTVTVDSINKTVTYLITTETCLVIVNYETESYNIVLVPKIGFDYRIEYK